MKPVFVFGSNLNGWHGAGAALTAYTEHGAVYGAGFGRHGNSYAIPTKGRRMEPLSLVEISAYVARFLQYAAAHQDEEFLVTRVGCGLAGYTEEQIAPFFKGAPENCKLPQGWRDKYGGNDR